MGIYIPGKQAVFSLLVSGTYYPVFCCKSWEFVQEQELVEVTSVNSGSDREYEAGMSTANIEATGVGEINNTGGRISVNYLRQQAVRRVVQSWKIVQTDTAGTALVTTFDGLITRTGISKQSGSLLGSSVSVKVTGGVSDDVIILPPTPSETFAIYDSINVGEWWYTHADLDGVEILEVWRETTQHDKVGGTPAPGGRQFLHVDNVGSGTVWFDSNQPAENGINQRIMILYKA